MVVMAWPTAALTGITQDRLGIPSRCTVQAPQSATPQPNLVPFMPSTSRKTHSRGMSGATSTLWVFPLILSVTMGMPPGTAHPCEKARIGFLRDEWDCEPCASEDARRRVDSSHLKCRM